MNKLELNILYESISNKNSAHNQNYYDEEQSIT